VLVGASLAFLEKSPWRLYTSLNQRIMSSWREDEDPTSRSIKKHQALDGSCSARFTAIDHDNVRNRLHS
jgi:hypothetical protein